MKWILYISLLVLAVPGVAQNYQIKKAPFNTEYSEYCAGLVKGGVVFSSTRKAEILETHLDEDDNYYSNLYLSKEKEQSKKEAELFSKEISTVLNEGSISFEPDGRAFWYTANIFNDKSRKLQEREFKLGIFKAEKKLGIWNRTAAFSFNSKDQNYNVAHPALSPDGKFMVFSSDMKGALGASDLWIVFRDELGLWSEPKPLPAGINTAKNELFPFIDAEGVLYFSSNGLSLDQGLDVYAVTEFLPDNYTSPVRMRAPINTPFDDYAFMIREDGETGYFSSNREELNDDVYSFQYNYPDFNGCLENYKPFMCYLIEETNITYIDSLPLAYIWEFGDGTSAEGFKHEHCYADTGNYKLNLNIIDTLTGVTYASINDMELSIIQPNQPYITSPDTLLLNEEALFSSKESEFTGFQVEEWFWRMGEEKFRGEEFYFTFKETGPYQIQLGALGVPDESGFQQKICVYKNILVVRDEAELEMLRELNRQLEPEPELVLNDDYLKDEVIISDQVEESKSEEVKESTYYVEVVESEEQMPLDDPYFDKLTHEITERYQTKDSTYVYSVGQSGEVFALWDIYKEVLDSGYVSSIVKQRRLEEFYDEIENVGYSAPLEENDEWNRTITDFANIQFNSNSSQITDVSSYSLDYIAAMMSIEEEFLLSIDAYTDNVGNSEYNLSLSERRAESVKRYLIRKGIAQSRLRSKGHGELNPISSNETEPGRAINRRVEFRIMTDHFK